MNQMVLGGGNSGPITMSSREIAELCEKRHDHVLRDIEKMLQDIADPRFGVSDFLSSYTDSTGRSLKEYRLPRDLTVTLITGYRADLRYRVVKRLEEMEGQQRAPQLPDLSDPAVLVPLLTSYAQRTQIAESKVAEMTPKVQALDRLEASEGSVNVRVAAKMLDMQEKKFIHWLQAHRWAFRQNGVGPLQAYTEKRVAGYLEHKPHTWFDKGRGEDRTVVQMMITPKGLAKLARIIPGANGSLI